MAVKSVEATFQDFESRAYQLLRQARLINEIPKYSTMITTQMLPTDSRCCWPMRVATYSLRYSLWKKHRDAGIPLIYNAEISAGSLMVPESRKLAAFMLGDPNEADWKKALVVDNILQKRTPSTAKRQARLIRNRLELLDRQGLRLIAEREKELVVQILFYACMKHSQLMRDFVSDVLVPHIKRLEMNLTVRDWDAFLVECTHRDSGVGEWSISTKEKLLQVILRVLAETKYLDSTRNLKIQRMRLHPDLKSYLSERGEMKIMELMELAS